MAVGNGTSSTSPPTCSEGRLDGYRAGRVRITAPSRWSRRVTHPPHRFLSTPPVPSTVYRSRLKPGPIPSGRRESQSRPTAAYKGAGVAGLVPTRPLWGDNQHLAFVDPKGLVVLRSGRSEDPVCDAGYPASPGDRKWTTQRPAPSCVHPIETLPKWRWAGRVAVAGRVKVDHLWAG